VVRRALLRDAFFLGNVGNVHFLAAADAEYFCGRVMKKLITPAGYPGPVAVAYVKGRVGCSRRSFLELIVLDCTRDAKCLLQALGNRSFVGKERQYGHGTSFYLCCSAI
jgi:hypothetical protein